MLCLAAQAETVSLSVTDSGGAVVSHEVVLAMPNDHVPDGKRLDASVDHVEKKFVPGQLVVRVGTLVHFPNSDKVRHQVYSFSPAKSFELPLYAGAEAKPVLFDKPGPVTLGCNIHDWMRGYIYVADSPWFTRTDEQGPRYAGPAARGLHRPCLASANAGDRRQHPPDPEPRRPGNGRDELEAWPEAGVLAASRADGGCGRGLLRRPTARRLA